MKAFLVDVRSPSPDEPITAVKVQVLVEVPGNNDNWVISIEDSPAPFWIKPQDVSHLGIEIIAVAMDNQTATPLDQ